MLNPGLKWAMSCARYGAGTPAQQEQLVAIKQLVFPYVPTTALNMLGVTAYIGAVVTGYCCVGLPAQQDQLVAIKQLEAIKDAYQAAPSNLRSRFQHLFLNVVDNPASRVKPDGKCRRQCLAQPLSAPVSHLLGEPSLLCEASSSTPWLLSVGTISKKANKRQLTSRQLLA